MPARPATLLPWWLPLALAACGPSIDPSTYPETSETSTTSPPISTPEPTGSTGLGTTTTSETTGTTGLDTGASTGEVLFIVPGDYVCSGTALEGGLSPRCIYECSVTAQDCPRGEKCMPWANDGGNAWNASRCSPIDPMPVPPGGECEVEGSGVSGIDDCALGSMCWGVDPRTLQGTCVELCDPRREPSTVCSAPTECMSLNEGYVPVCLLPCDPLQSDACPVDAECRHVADDGGFYCLPSVGGQVLGSSQHCDDTTCTPTQLCIDSVALGTCEADRCCTELCDASVPEGNALCAAVDPALACISFYEVGTAPAGLEHVGACILPP